jgi:hypothetical protein
MTRRHVRFNIRYKFLQRINYNTTLPKTNKLLTSAGMIQEDGMRFCIHEIRIKKTMVNQQNGSRVTTDFHRPNKGTLRDTPGHTRYEASYVIVKRNANPSCFQIQVKLIMPTKLLHHFKKLTNTEYQQMRKHIMKNQ